MSLALRRPPLAFLALALLSSLAMAGSDQSFVIVNPGGRGDQGLAAGFLSDLGSALAASWPPGAGDAPTFTAHYHVNEADALASIRGSHPAFGLVSTSFYLRHRKALAMTPLLVPVRPEGVLSTVHVVVRNDDQATRDKLARGSLDQLKLGGHLCSEADWLLGVVLAGMKDPGQARLSPVARPLATARLLGARQIDGAVFSDADWRTLQEAGKATGLVVGFTSKPLPEGPMVAFGTATGANSPAARCAEAFTHFGETAPGRAALERMSLAGYEYISSDYYDSVAALMAAAPKLTIAGVAP